MPRRRLLIGQLIAWLTIVAAPVYATTCRPFEERYVVRCSKGACEPRFRAREVRAHGSMCSRRLVVEAFPDWALPVIQEMLLARSEAPLSGTLEMRVEPRLWPRQENEQWLSDTLRSPRHFVEIRAVTEGEQALRAALEKRSLDGLWESRRAWVIDGLIITSAGVLLGGSFVLFVRRLCRAPRPTHLWSFVYVLMLDVFIFLLALNVLAAHPLAGGAGLALASLLALLIVLIEILTFGVARVRGWGAATRPGAAA
jgi:hypothetical protein